MSFPLTKGYHTITIQIDSSIQSEIYRRMFNIVEEISDLYLEVVKLTGGDIDSNKKWEIEKYLPHADDCLNRWVSEIDEIIDLIDKHSKVDSKKELKELCKENLAVYSVPKEFEFRDSLPKTLMNKIDFKKLEKEEQEKFDENNKVKE